MWLYSNWLLAATSMYLAHMIPQLETIKKKKNILQKIIFLKELLLRRVLLTSLKIFPSCTWLKTIHVYHAHVVSQHENIKKYNVVFQKHLRITPERKHNFHSSILKHNFQRVFFTPQSLRDTSLFFVCHWLPSPYIQRKEDWLELQPRVERWPK